MLLHHPVGLRHQIFAQILVVEKSLRNVNGVHIHGDGNNGCYNPDHPLRVALVPAGYLLHVAIVPTFQVFFELSQRVGAIQQGPYQLD